MKPPDNAPPELIQPTPEQAREPIPFVLNRPERNLILIVARDSDNDPLDMVWTMGAFDPNDYVTRTVPGTQRTTFSIELPRDEALDGEELWVSVFDDLEVTDVVFVLEVP